MESSDIHQLFQSVNGFSPYFDIFLWFYHPVLFVRFLFFLQVITAAEEAILPLMLIFF